MAAHSCKCRVHLTHKREDYLPRGLPQREGYLRTFLLTELLSARWPRLTLRTHRSGALGRLDKRGLIIEFGSLLTHTQPIASDRSR